MPGYRLVFAGTPTFAAAHLSALVTSPHEVVAVYTRPDRPAGRGRRVQAGPVKQLALEHGLPVLQPVSLRSVEQTAALAAFNADLVVVVAYGLILPPAILVTPRFGCLNVHASLLPRWRGAAPVERALLAGDEVTGITIMRMDAGLDTGDILYQARVPIAADDTGLSLETKLAECGSRTLLHSLENLDALFAGARRQDDSRSSYADRLAKSESLIDWRQPAQATDRLIRAGVGRLPAWSLLDGERVRLLQATHADDLPQADPGTIVAQDAASFQVACKDSLLRVTRVQLAGKKPMSVRALQNSRPGLFAVGKSFSNSP